MTNKSFLWPQSTLQVISNIVFVLKSDSSLNSEVDYNQPCHKIIICQLSKKFCFYTEYSFIIEKNSIFFAININASLENYSLLFFFRMKFSDKLIGVHCTHGLNRSGFMICRYMIEEMKIPPIDAISGEATTSFYYDKIGNYAYF